MYLTLELDTGLGAGLRGWWVVVGGVRRGVSAWCCAWQGWRAKREHAPFGLMADFRDHIETPFAKALKLAGAPAPSLLPAWFGRPIDRTTIANWKAGRRLPPLWAVARIERAIRERDEEARATLARIKTSSGLEARARNLAKWKAENPR